MAKKDFKSKNLVDAGKYNKNHNLYEKLVTEMYDDNPPITLPAEYASFIKDNQLRLLIRLARYKFAARLLKSNDKIMEIGCGSGLGSIFMAQHCAHVTGLDIKKGEIDEAIAINRRDNVTFIVEDFFKMKKSPEYDAVIALDVIEHLEPSLGKKLIKGISELCKPSGLAVIGSPSIYSYQYQSPLSKASHVHCYDLPELCSAVENYFGRAIPFSMNDELVHTGYHKMSWYYFVLGVASQQHR